MKKLKLFLLPLFLLFSLAACDLLQESEIVGTLTINPKSGWNELEFMNEKTKTLFRLYNGRYKFSFDQSWLPFTDPKIRISDSQNRVVGSLTIPRSVIKDDGTFEMYMNNEKSRNSFNILGGRRVTVLSRQRFVKLRAYCTYEVSYACITTDEKGNAQSSMCTRTEIGDQDQIWERRQVKSLYRILFDGNDIVNVADFSGQSQTRIEDVKIGETDCR